MSYVDAARQVRGTPTPTTTPALTPTVNTIDNKQELLQSTK